MVKNPGAANRQKDEHSEEVEEDGDSQAAQGGNLSEKFLEQSMRKRYCTVQWYYIFYVLVV